MVTSCASCGKPTPNPKYCSRSCSARVNNRLAPKRSPQYRVGVGPQERPCSRCKVTKPFADFTVERQVDGSERPSSRCKACTNELMKGRPQYRDPVARAVERRRRVYGLSEDDYARLRETQNGMCAFLCGRPAEVIDHCHDTGRVRGLLCNPCNQALGILGDGMERLEVVLAYLRP